MAAKSQLPLADYVEHLERFCAIAERMKDPSVTSSLRSIVKDIREQVRAPQRLRSLTLYLAESSIDALEGRFGVPLFYRARGSGKNQLTKEGHWLHKRATLLLRRLEDLVKGDRSEPIRASISRTILTYITPDVMREAFRDASSSSDSQLHDYLTRTRFDDGYITSDVLERFRLDEVDFAIVWDTEERRSSFATYKHIVYDINNAPSYDLVCIFNPSHRFANSGLQFVPREELRKERVYVMPREHHVPAIDDILGISDTEYQSHVEFEALGERVIMEDYSMMIRAIRMGMGGVGIVPALYRELDRHRRGGDLNFAMIEGSRKISLALVYRPQSVDEPRPDLELMNRFRRHLMAQPRVSGWSIPQFAPDQFLESPGLHGFRHAYYLKTEEVGHMTPHWRHAQVQISHVNGKTGSYGGLLHYTDTIGTDCDVIAKFADDVLTFRVKPIKESHDQYHHYVVTLNSGFKACNKEVMCLTGLWTGLDRKGNPESGAFILATNEIPDNLRVGNIYDGYDDMGDLNGITRVAMLRTFTNTRSHPTIN